MRSASSAGHPLGRRATKKVKVGPSRARNSLQRRAVCPHAARCRSEELAGAQRSAGQQRRVALARLWLSRATLWILDEPLTAIDKSGVEKLMALFVRHAQQGGAVIITTHQDLPDGDYALRKIQLTATEIA